MYESAKNLLATTVRDWNKFIAEREKMEKASRQVAEVTTTVIMELLAFLKAQHIDANSDSADAMTLMGSPVQVVPEVEASYPIVKTMIHLRCAAAARSIVVNPNMTVSAGGVAIPLDQLSKAVPVQFTANAAQFLQDAFLGAAKAATSATKESSAPASGPSG